MASFGINLDLRLNGETALNRAIRGTKTLENIVKRLNDKPLDLSNIGGASRLDEGRLGKARKDIIAFAQELTKTQKPLSNTEAGIREYISAFNQLAANTKSGTPAFNAFVGVVAKAEKELQDLAIATENAKRAQLGLVSVEEEAANLAKKNQQAKAKVNEAKARKENERQASREAAALKRANREKEREAKLAKQKKGRAIGDLAASVGFPLLFGGGLGSVAGGATGSLVGSALGIGFGGQILGSAIGQQFDKAAAAANTFAIEATKASTSIGTLVEKFGIAGTGSAASLGFAETLGIGGAARAAAGGSFFGIVGEEGVKSIKELGRSAEDSANALSRFGAATTAAFAPLLTSLNDLTTGLFGGISKPEQLKRAEEQAGKSSAAITGVGAGARAEFEAARRARLAEAVETLGQDPEVKAYLDLEKQIQKVVKDRIDLAKQGANLEEGRLNARRDVLAVEQGNLAIKGQQNKLDILEIELLEGKLSPAKKRELELEKSLTKEAIRQSKAARENARIAAERQIEKEQISSAAKRIQSITNIQKAELSLQKITQGRFAFYEEDLDMLDTELDRKKATLELERKSALIGVTELERRSAINREYDLQTDLLQKQYYLNVANREQQQGANNIAKLRVQQALQLQSIEAKIAADRAVRSTDPSAQLSTMGAGLGFFADSAALENEQALLFIENLDLMSSKLKDVQDQIEKGSQIGSNIGEDGLNKLRDQEDIIKNQILLFEQYQPAIDAAALAQARFNDALAFASPVVDSLFNNLQQVVAGTKSAKEAFADFLMTVADLLMETATQMIATYIAIGIARAFAGMGGGEASSSDLQVMGASPTQANTIAGGGSVGWSTDMGPNGGVLNPKSFSSFAQGGFVSSPTNALIGEGGEPEYVIPQSKMRESMSRYSRGSRGGGVIPSAGGSSASGDGGVAVAAPIDVRYTVERINSVDYVTADQFQSGMQRAASQGAQRGEQNTLKRLQMSGSTRRRLGM